MIGFTDFTNITWEVKGAATEASASDKLIPTWAAFKAKKGQKRPKKAKKCQKRPKKAKKCQKMPKRPTNAIKGHQRPKLQKTLISSLFNVKS